MYFYKIFMYILVYFFIEYHELEGSVSSSSEGGPSRSGSPTPCNSPKAPRKPPPLQLEKLSSSAISSLRGIPQPSHGTLTRSQVTHAVSTLQRQNATVRCVTFYGRTRQSEVHRMYRIPVTQICCSAFFMYVTQNLSLD